MTRRNYPLGRAFFQVALAILFATLLWPHQASEIQAARRTTTTPDRALRLLDNPDADVRAAMCELLALREQADALPRLDAMADADKSPDVRAACKIAADELREVGGEADDTLLPTGEP